MRGSCGTTILQAPPGREAVRAFVMTAADGAAVREEVAARLAGRVAAVAARSGGAACGS